MIGLLRGILTLTVTIVITVVASLNLQNVDVFWNPIDTEHVLSVPLFAIILGSTLFGFIVGALMVWLNMSPLRKQKRSQKKEIKVLKKEVSQLKDDKFTAQPPAEELFPALPSQ